MTVKELIDRLNELNCPDYEVELNNGESLTIGDVRFANSGTKVILGISEEIGRLANLIEELRSYHYDIESIIYFGRKFAYPDNKEVNHTYSFVIHLQK